MQHFKIPELQILKGEEAIAALKEYVQELNENGDENLTPTQTQTLIKLAQGLISTIESESQSSKPKKKQQIFTRLKNVIAENLTSKEDLRYIPEEIISSHNILHSSTPSQQPRIV